MTLRIHRVLIITFAIIAEQNGKSRSFPRKFKTTTSRLGVSGNPHKIVQPEGGVSGVRGRRGRDASARNKVLGAPHSWAHFARSFLFFPPIYRQDILRTSVESSTYISARMHLRPSFLLSSPGSMGMREHTTPRDFTVNQPLKYEVTFTEEYFTEFI